MVDGYIRHTAKNDPTTPVYYKSTTPRERLPAVEPLEVSSGEDEEKENRQLPPTPALKERVGRRLRRIGETDLDMEESNKDNNNNKDEKANSMTEDNNDHNNNDDTLSNPLLKRKVDVSSTSPSKKNKTGGNTTENNNNNKKNTTLSKNMTEAGKSPPQKPAIRPLTPRKLFTSNANSSTNSNVNSNSNSNSNTNSNSKSNLNSISSSNTNSNSNSNSNTNSNLKSNSNSNSTSNANLNSALTTKSNSDPNSSDREDLDTIFKAEPPPQQASIFFNMNYNSGPPGRSSTSSTYSPEHDKPEEIDDSQGTFDSPMSKPTSVFGNFWSRSSNSSYTSPTTLGKGLRNIGNTCYLNAVLRALLSLKPLTNDLQSQKLTSLSLPPNSFYTSVLNVYNELNKNNFGVCDPKPVKDAVGDIESRFRGFSQQDAHEFLTTSLNLLSEELYAHLKKEKGDKKEDEESDEKKNTSPQTDATTKDGLKDRSPTINHRPPPTTITTTLATIDLTDSQPASGLFISDSDNDSECNFSNNCNFSTSTTNNGPHVNSNGTTNGNHGTNATSNGTITGTSNGTSMSGDETDGAHNGTNGTNGANGTNGTKKSNVISPSKLKCLQADTHFRSTYCPTSRNFDCEVQAKYTCTKCEAKNRVKELYRDLSLDIPRGSELDMLGLASESLSTSDLLQIFFREEVLDKKCEKCGHPQASVKKRITKLPNVLVLHIKRFLPDPETMTYDKNKDNVKTDADFFLDMFCDDAVSFPPASKQDEQGDILAKDSQPPSFPKHACRRHKYVLHCIVMHRGYSAQGGHYVTYVHDQKAHEWKCYDDSIVRQAEAKKVMAEMQDGYIFFYMYDNLTV